MAAKKTKGRQKVEMKRIENKDDRLITFLKRRSGIFKKASELVTLTGAEIAVVAFSPTGKPFSSGHPSVESIINRFLEEHSNIDNSTYNLMEANRRKRIGELIQKYNEMQHEVEEKKEKSHKLKGKIKEIDCKSWWDTSIEDLNLDDLIKLGKKFEKLQMTLQSKIVKKNNGASSSQAPKIYNTSGSDANDPNASVFLDTNH
ncbi:unnamed protein product [Dovyalis caffra]|uniref:MADS-box domain-containing protein n=1 Tax=Dovyalis caffra TaxID=77055 RepID=A0AAV1RBU4_9ROSI|nr:unnamed protein product [Dovyalis caffra]